MIGVIADDMTGAAEIAAVGLLHGLQAEVILAGAPKGETDLVCLDTDSRTCSPLQASERARIAANFLQESGAEWIYKKTDSVLRGNVAAELFAIMATLGLPKALLIPANPSLGRTIVEGQYFIAGRPIHETEFAHDPHHPRTSPNVLHLLGGPAGLPLSVRRPGAALQESGITVGESATLEEIRLWTKVPRQACLLAGGADFFSALLNRQPVAAPEFFLSGKELFICGSASTGSRQFIAAQTAQGVPEFSFPESIAITGRLTATQVSSLSARVISALRDHRRAVLHIGLPLLQGPSIADTLTRELVRVANQVLTACPIPQVFVEGGATAVALARSLGWTRLRVAAELARGVAVLSVLAHPSQRLILKPGSYSWPAGVA